MIEEVENLTGLAYPTGPKGDTGAGVIAGGAAGQVLSKKSDNDYDTEWVDQTSGTGKLNVVGINVSGNIQAQTDWSYTGYSVTIPANSFFVITGRCSWNDDPIRKMCFSTHSIVRKPVASDEKNYDSSAITITYSEYNEKPEPVTYYLWASYGSGKGLNPVKITGWYVTV